MAHAGRPRRPPALRDEAGIATEHRVCGIEHQHAGPELRAHHGDQLSQQAGINLVLPGLPGIRAGGAAHLRSSPPSGMAVVTLTATPPRTPLACR